MRQILTLTLALATMWTAGASDIKDNSDLKQVAAQAAQFIAARTPSTNTATGPRSTSVTDASGFVMISDVIPDVVVEPRYFSNYNFVGVRVDGYEEPIAMCTREAAAALKLVADELRVKGYLLKIYDAYRPQQAVDHFVRWTAEADTSTKADFYPDFKVKSKLFPDYIAKKSGHTKGSTLDLTIVHADTKEEVDMGGTFDFLGVISHYKYNKITKEQQENRKILHDAMVSNGFKAYSQEWWHFTLKDQPYPDTFFSFPLNSNVLLP